MNVIYYRLTGLANIACISTSVLMRPGSQVQFPHGITQRVLRTGQQGLLSTTTLHLEMPRDAESCVCGIPHVH